MKEKEWSLPELKLELGFRSMGTLMGLGQMRKIKCWANPLTKIDFYKPKFTNNIYQSSTSLNIKIYLYEHLLVKILYLTHNLSIKLIRRISGVPSIYHIPFLLGLKIINK